MDGLVLWLGLILGLDLVLELGLGHSLGLMLWQVVGLRLEFELDHL
jgi:hypothetical protein